jgi:lambda repressor-like predicted transcriptional regulator
VFNIECSTRTFKADTQQPRRSTLKFLTTRVAKKRMRAHLLSTGHIHARNSRQAAWQRSPIDRARRGSHRRTEEIIAEVLGTPSRFDELFQCLLDDDPIVRMRAADVTEKVTIHHPEWLQPYKRTLIGKVAAIEQQEVRWHVAQMIPRLNLTALERERVVKILLGYLGDKSAIVKAFSLQALTDLVVDGGEDAGAEAVDETGETQDLSVETVEAVESPPS